MGKRPKTVQLDERLVIELCKWHLCGEHTPEREAMIVQGLQAKVDAAARRRAYKASKSVQERPGDA